MIIEGIVKMIFILIVVDKTRNFKSFVEISAKDVSWKY
jgi:hypothetical protein